MRQPALWTSGDSGWFYFYEMNFEKLPQAADGDYAAWKEKIYELKEEESYEKTVKIKTN